MQITMRKISDLKPYAQNAKEHPEEQVKKIAESIVQFGFLVPLVVTVDGSIVAGHGRYLAAQYLKRKEVPCVEAEGLTDEQLRAFRIADNKVAESAWSSDPLKIELQELRMADMFTGFSPAEVEILLNPPEIKTDDSRGSSTPVISYTIVFDDIEQQETWFAFLKSLKVSHPEPDTTAAKLLAFITEHADI